MKKDFISFKDLSGDEIVNFLKLTERLKANKTGSPNLLAGRTIGLIFQKPSNRTRVSFEVGISQLGGHAIYLGPNEINLGVRETTADVSKTLSRYVDGIVARVNNHDDLLDMKKHATVPIINGLSDLEHPCQGLADLFTIYEKFGAFQGINMVYIGDGNNVCHTLMLGCAKVGMNLTIASPEGYEPNEKFIELTKKLADESGANFQILRDPEQATKGAHVIYTDTWVSMGQEAEADARLAHFEKFQVNDALVKDADKDYIFMHCLPAHRGEEVSESIIDGKHSVIFDQAENRLHCQKAILIHIYERRKSDRS